MPVAEQIIFSLRIGLMTATFVLSVILTMNAIRRNGVNKFSRTFWMVLSFAGILASACCALAWKSVASIVSMTGGIVSDDATRNFTALCIFFMIVWSGVLMQAITVSSFWKRLGLALILTNIALSFSWAHYLGG